MNFLIGIIAGVFGGLVGIGGGPIMISGMVLLAGFDQHTARGSSLLAMVPLGTVGAFTHWRLGNVDTGFLKVIIPGIIIGTYAGGSYAHLLPELTLRVIFAAVLIWAGSRSVKSSVSSCE